mmetsp:Transcript_415/g.455  ORF Transcript_415/g.455 Transcript_415/m.455 type:complete len:84 (+) Transcript_415:219-470(+)
MKKKILDSFRYYVCYRQEMGLKQLSVASRHYQRQNNILINLCDFMTENDEVKQNVVNILLKQERELKHSEVKESLNRKVSRSE